MAAASANCFTGAVRSCSTYPAAGWVKPQADGQTASMSWTEPSPMLRFVLLIRPDGYVAWAADTFETCAEDRLHTALQRWFGVSVAERGAARRDGGLSSAPATERTA